MSQPDALEDFRLRIGALSHLARFREFMEPSGHIDFKFPHMPHHTVMADAFERVMSVELKRLMILMPPASAKSTLCIQFVMWWLARFPEHNILRVSATQSLAETFARRCRSALQTEEFRLLSDSTLDANQQSLSKFATTLGGSVTSAGAGTSIIGLRSNLNILDDPISSWEQAHSESQRQAQVDWYFSEYRSRLVPGAPEIIVTTRWHHQDIAGHIMKSAEADTWEIIRIPMVCDDPENDPLHRELGDRLWPEWFTEQMVVEAQRDPEKWSGMYQQIPLHTEGDWLSHTDIEIVDHAPDDLGIYAALDIAISEKQTADASVCTIAGMADDGTLYILDMWKDRVSPEKIIDELLLLFSRWSFRECLQDDDPGAQVFRTLAHKILREKRIPLPIVPLPTRGRDKMARATAFRGLAKMGAVKMLKGNWNAEMLSEICEFPYGPHDDIIDTLSLLGRRAAKMAPEHSVRKVEQAPIEGRVIEQDGQLFLRQPLDELWAEQPARSIRI